MSLFKEMLNMALFGKKTKKKKKLQVALENVITTA